MSSKKKLKLGQIDVDFPQFALVVHYTTELHHFDQDGNPLKIDREPGQKLVRLPRGLQVGELQDLATEVVEKCKYIHASKVNEVERLLYALWEHECAHGGVSPMQQSGNQTPNGTSGNLFQGSGSFQGSGQLHGSGHSRMQSAPPKHVQAEPSKRKAPLLPSAELRCIDDYTNELYDDRMETKIHGAKCILRVCTEPANLDLLADHDTFLGVLSRELRESSKKSYEFSVCICCTILCFSHFSEFHAALTNHSCGDVTMRVLEYESQRSLVRKEDLDRRTMRLQQLGDQATKEDRKLLAKDEKKYNIQLNRQSKLMHVCLMALMNIAEEISVEKKMVNRKMVSVLTQTILRDSEELLITALQFLKKLSVFEGNKDQMIAPATLARLVHLSQHPNVNVALLALRVIYNLSFDANVRASLSESRLMSLLVDQLRSPPFRHVVLRLLYHLTMDDSCKSTIAYLREGLVMVLQLVVHFPEPRVGRDLVGLLVNLSTHPRTAGVIVESGLFPQVMMRVLKTRDPLLCKVVRHVSSHREVVDPMYELLMSDGVRMSKWMNEFVRVALCCVDNPDLLVEVLGTLVNITHEDAPWGELCEAGLVDLVTRLLVPSFSEDDIVLECIMLVSNLALCQESALHVAGSRLPAMLQDILLEKREDEEIVLQILYAFQCLTVFDEVRDTVLQESDLVPCLMEFARARNPAILQQASQTLQLVAEYAGDAMGEAEEGSWIEQIKAFRFEQHNADWCKFVSWELNGGGMNSTSDRMAPRDYMMYGDQDDASADGEEEFAFHSAGGGVVWADADDLANRQWQGEDMEQFMHSARLGR